MMLKILILALAVTASLIPYSAYSDGADSSSGGELIAHQDNPWFVGKAPIQVCLETSDNFTQDYDAAKNEVNEALKDWISGLRSANPRETAQPLPDGERKKLTLSYAFQAECDERSELKILLGKMTKEVRDTLKANSFGYVSYAKRTSYNERTGRSKGTIWVIPDLGPDSYRGKNQGFWNFGKYTYHVVQHELGHVFGLRHSHKTAAPTMAEGLPQAFVEDGLKPRSQSIMMKYLRGRVLTSQTLNAVNFISRGGTFCTSILRATGGDALDSDERKAVLEKHFERSLSDSDKLCLASLAAPDNPDHFNLHTEIQRADGTLLTRHKSLWWGVSRSENGITGNYLTQSTTYPLRFNFLLEFYDVRLNTIENGRPIFVTALARDLTLSIADTTKIHDFSFLPDEYKKSPFGD